jgi:hypothetical protein
MSSVTPNYLFNPVYLGVSMVSRGKLGPLKNLMKPVFTDNSMVYYKPGSLAAGGIGTVRNSSVKVRKI